jgi:hypothetical protein
MKMNDKIFRFCVNWARWQLWTGVIIGLPLALVIFAIQFGIDCFSHEKLDLWAQFKNLVETGYYCLAAGAMVIFGLPIMGYVGVVNILAGKNDFYVYALLIGAYPAYFLAKWVLIILCVVIRMPFELIRCITSNNNYRPYLPLD